MKIKKPEHSQLTHVPNRVVERNAICQEHAEKRHENQFSCRFSACIFRTEPIVSTSGGIIQKNQWATDMKEVLPSSRIFISARTVQKTGINDHQEHRQIFEESL